MISFIQPHKNKNFTKRLRVTIVLSSIDYLRIQNNVYHKWLELLGLHLTGSVIVLSNN